MANKSLMVAVDFGITSESAFEEALALARRLGARLDLVHVCPPIPPEAAQSGAVPPYVQTAERELNRLADRAAAEGVVAATFLRDETVVFGLLEAIDELEPQLVIVGSHGRDGVMRMLLGSVSETLARRSPVPVLIVPAPERAQAAERAAWSCKACGHILGDRESNVRCAGCGREPAEWISARLDGPDPELPAVGEGAACEVAPPDTQAAVGLFATAPAGVSGTETNAELRIRRF